MERGLRIELPIRQSWANVELLRRAVLNCFAVVFANLDDSRSVANVIGELLENAIKYGDWSREQDHSLFLSIEGKGRHVGLVIEHPCDPDGAHVSNLMKVLAWLKSFPSPAEAYRAQMVMVAQAPADVRMAQLGLARIAHEGNCALSAAVVGRSLRITGELAL